MPELEMHSVVALVTDLPEAGLVRGQVGTVVADCGPGVYEVEFCDGDGRTYAMAAVKADQLMLLHHGSLQLSRRWLGCQ
jgi:hypothetical protein